MMVSNTNNVICASNESMIRNWWGHLRGGFGKVNKVIMDILWAIKWLYETCILAMLHAQSYWIPTCFTIGMLVQKKWSIIESVTAHPMKCAQAFVAVCFVVLIHDDIIKWKYFPRYWPFCGEFTGDRWVPRTKVSDGALMFSLICTWINGWVNNRTHCDVTVMNIRLCGMCVVHLFIFFMVASLALG